MPNWTAEQFALAFVPLFIAIDALGTLPLFTPLTEGMSRHERRRTIHVATATAAIVGICFLFFGQFVLKVMGISVGSFAIAGGLILLILSIRYIITGRMMEIIKKEMTAVVPIGTPLLAGPATITTLLLLIDNDIVKTVKCTIQGIDVTDDTMAVDLIKQAHEIKDFLHQKHTVQFMRQEQSKPRLIDRTTRGTWEAKGGKDLTQAAREEARRILKTHQPEPLSDGVKKTLKEIVESAEKGLAHA